MYAKDATMFQQTANFACPKVNPSSSGLGRAPRKRRRTGPGPLRRAGPLRLAMASKKSERLVVRLTPEDRALLERVAAADELEVSTWVRRTAVQAARRWEKDRDPEKAD